MIWLTPFVIISKNESNKVHVFGSDTPDGKRLLVSNIDMTPTHVITVITCVSVCLCVRVSFFLVCVWVCVFSS